MNLPRLSVKRAVTFSMLFVAITGFGFMGMRLLPIDLFPDITMPVAVIFADYSGASPEDMEQLVSQPLEEAVSSVSGIKNITSDSRQGVSFLMLEFAWGTDMDQAKQDIRENIDMFSGMLPQEMNTPMVVAFDPSMMPIAFLGVSGNLPIHELRAVAKDQIEPLLERIPGVAMASTTGGLDRQIQIRLDPTRMRARGVGVQQIVNAIRMENVQMPSGTFDQGFITYAVHTQGKYTEVEQIAETIVGYAGARPVYVRDVADVVDTYEDETAGTHINGAPGILMVIMKQSDANTVKVARESLRQMPSINEMLPEGVALDVIFEQSGMIERSIGNLANTAILAFLMAALVLLFFLRNVRASLIVALSIPLSVLFGLFVMYLLGLTLNILTLAGIALAVGMLVDNSIVVLENAVRFMEDGQPPMEAAVNGPSEILMAIVASTLTTISVFLPVLFVPGIAGVMFKDMAITICVTLAASLFVAVSLVPLMGSRMLRPESERPPRRPWVNRLDERVGRILAGLEGFYAGALNAVLHHRRLTIVVTVLIFLGSMGLVALLDQEWIPESQDEQIVLNVERAPGTSIEEMEETMGRLERIAMATVPEAYAVTSSYGPGEGFASFSSTASNQGQLEIDLVDIGERKRDTVEIRNAVLPLLENEPGTKVTVQEMGMHFMTGGDIIVEIFGNDLEQSQGIAVDLLERIRALPDVFDADSTYEQGRPELEVVIDRDQLASLGLSGSLVTSTLSTYLRGSVATWYTEGSREYEVLVRADESHRSTAAAIQNLSISTPMGQQIPMADFVSLEPSRAPTTISRKNEQRVVYVNIDVEGAALGRVTRQTNQILEEYDWPAGYQWAVTGAAEDMAESFMWLFVALLGGSLLVYMVMSSQFESLLDPFIIIFTIPLALIGVVWVLLLTGTSLSVISLIGVIILAGIVVNNSIVLIDYVEQLRTRGLEMFEAVRVAAKRRMRPILMTALTTILAMVPLAMEWGTGAEMWAPMARSVIGGLIMATLLTLIIIPVVYTIFGDLRLRSARKRLEKGKVVGRRYVRMMENGSNGSSQPVVSE